MLTTSERPLTVVERQSLSARFDKAQRDNRIAISKTVLLGVSIFALLMLLTVSLSNAPFGKAAWFWGPLSGVITAWVAAPWLRQPRDQVVALGVALRANRARVTRVQAVRMVEFEGLDGESPCYAFELGPASTLFTFGEEFAGAGEFPTSDFSIVEILAARGRPIDKVIERHGTRLIPERVIPAATRSMLEIPEHMSVLSLPLDRIPGDLAHIR